MRPAFTRPAKYAAAASSEWVCFSAVSALSDAYRPFVSRACALDPLASCRDRTSFGALASTFAFTCPLCAFTASVARRGPGNNALAAVAKARGQVMAHMRVVHPEVLR